MPDLNKAELRRLADAAPERIQDDYLGMLRADMHRKLTPSVVLSLLDECDDLERFKTACMEWHDKTEWVRKDAKPKELGMHVADVITARITKAEAERDAALAELQAAKLLLEQCNEVIAEDGGVYIELRCFLSGEMPASEVIALLGKGNRNA